MQADWQLGATHLAQHFRSLQSRRQQLEAELVASSSSQAHQAEGAAQAVPLQRMKELWESLQVPWTPSKISWFAVLAVLLQRLKGGGQLGGGGITDSRSHTM